MTIFFTSDLHFGHKNILDICNRPWISVEEMDEALIENWNGIVSNSDVVYNLGDVSWYPWDTTKVILDRLNGKIVYLRGNHDNRTVKHIEMLDYLELKLDKKLIILFHYPIFDWNRRHHGSWHLYGHIHDSISRRVEGALNVGIDSVDLPRAREYRPLAWEEIQEFYPK